MISHKQIDNAQRLPAEILYAEELRTLKKHDSGIKPYGWVLSPKAVLTFILGTDGQTPDGVSIERKIFGNDLVVERSIVTLAGQRGLILVGPPGTAKSLLSELLAAAISGSSINTIQGGAGVFDEQIRYNWNYAMLLKEGPGPSAMIPGPLYLAMAQGKILRFEEMTRCQTEVQDSLIPVLSDRILHIPEYESGDGVLLARNGFNVIATANLRDRGVNEMSSALKRRFNFETMQPIKDQQQEAGLVTKEVNRLLKREGINEPATPNVIELIVTVCRELRTGEVLGTKMEPLSGSLSTAEVVQVAFSASVEGWYMDRSPVNPSQMFKHLVGTVVKDDEDDRKRVANYLRFIKKERKESPEWTEFFNGEKWL